jgi:nucleoid-associated protein YgaU
MAPGQLSVRLSVILAAIFSVFLLIGGPAEAEGPPPPSSEYVVSAGDTLWSIAKARVGPGVDVRGAIAEIRETSGLSSSDIHPGQVLLIPEIVLASKG